jgi:hypothetical protein
MVIFAKLFGGLRTKRQVIAGFSGTSFNLPSPRLMPKILPAGVAVCGRQNETQ